MLDEFDDTPAPAIQGRAASGARSGVDPVPRLIARIYVAGDKRLRARILEYLLKPLGTLGLVAIAAGAFAGFLQRRSADVFMVSLDDVTRYSSDQITELARFVWQVSPESLQSIANTLADTPMGVTAFGASALVLLLRALESSGGRGLARPPALVADGPRAHRGATIEAP